MRAAKILIACCFAVTVVDAQPPQKKPSAPDIYLVTIDTLRADHVHCYGYERVQTPALDGLAKDGIRFAQAFTPSPITNTSHTTILTGLLPSSHGVTDFAVPLAATHPTWAELLKQKGYHTAAFIGAVILDSKSLAPGLDRGFDFYDNFPEHPLTKSRFGRVERRGMDVVQRAEKWMNANPAGPHFVWLHLYDPHDPYEPPPPYSQTYKDRLYDGEIAYADSALGNFVAYLKKLGRYENSVIVVVGDHGEGLGEHHEDTHGIFLYDSTTHVPLIKKVPGRSNAARVVDAQVRTTDIFPTALDLLHVPAPERLDGESLKPYFGGAESASRTAFGETDYSLRFGWAPLRSVRTDGFKFIEAPKPELYDLQKDPGELKNEYGPTNEMVQKGRKLLTDLQAKKPAAAAGSAATASPGSANQLQALGYVGQTETSSTNAPSGLPDPKDKIEEQNLLHTAMIASEDERPAEARSALEKVLQLDPKSPTALKQIGELELKFNEPKAADDQFEAALLLEPKSVEAQIGAAKTQIAQGNFADAAQELEGLSKSHPDNADVFDALAEAYAGAGRREDAQQAESRAKQLQKNKRR